MLQPDIYEVTQVGQGALYVMPRPNPLWLKQDIKYFARIGVNLVVSHLEKPEEAELGLAKEEALLNKAGIDFLSYPIKDRSLPANADHYFAFIEQVYQQLMDGKSVAVHCRVGIGRTGVTSACLLIRDGYESQGAIDMISAARGIQMPDTQAQYDFICDYSPKETRGI